MNSYLRKPISPSTLGWTLLGSANGVRRQQTITLANVRPRRYYLLWITNLGPDPAHASKNVQIAELTLQRAAQTQAR